MWALRCLRWSFGEGGEQKSEGRDAERDDRVAEHGEFGCYKKGNNAADGGRGEWMSLIQRRKSGLFSQECPQEAFKGLTWGVQHQSHSV